MDAPSLAPQFGDGQDPSAKCFPRMGPALRNDERGWLREECGQRSSRLTGVLRLFLAVTAVLLVATPLAAQRLQDRPNAAEAERAIEQLRSPYCPGLMLETCPSPQAGALRDSIYDMAAQGATSEEIVEWMLGRHGEEWRGVPRMSGAGLLAWVIPPIALLLGMGVLIGWLRSKRKEPLYDTPSSTANLSEADRDQLARALRDWEDAGEEEV